MTTILVAGAAGGFGHRIVDALIARGASVRALVKPGGGDRKELAGKRVDIVAVPLDDDAALKAACGGVDCVVSALNGMYDVIVDAQVRLLAAAVAAGVPRFIPSDYSGDMFKLEWGENRNFDLRRAFHARLDAAPIRSTSVLIGMFMDMLQVGSPLFDAKNGSVTFWGEPDQLVDMTTMDDAAQVVAAVALDPQAPRVVRVAGDQLSPRQIADTATQVLGRPVQVTRAGSLDDLAEKIVVARARDPEAEKKPFAEFQALQYMHNMLSGRAKLEPLDNARFPEVTWTTTDKFMAALPDPHADPKRRS